MSDIFDLFAKISKPKKDVEPPRYIIAGLGNPGRDYADTRHNAGFIAIEGMCRALNVECNRQKFKSFVADCEIGGKRVLFMMPQTMMNASGIAIGEAASFYKIPPENIVIIVDDIYLEPGQMRIRKGGTDGGHNGLKSIIYQLGADNFPRIRIGVGKKPSKEYDLAAWVLGKITKDDFSAMLPCFNACLDAARLIMNNETDKAMGKYNGMKNEHN